MAAKELPRFILRNCNAYIDRESQIGQASEIQTPNFKAIFEEVRNAGMVKARPVLMGFEVEDADIKLTSLDFDVLSIFGLAPGVEKEFLFTGQLVSEDEEITNASYYVRGKLAEVDLGGWKPGELTEFGHIVKPLYGKLEIGDRNVLEWDDFDVKVSNKSMFPGLRDSLLVD